MDKKALFKISYGLYVVTTQDADKQSGCISNTVVQLTSDPVQVSVTLNKQNHTTELIQNSGKFNVSCLSTETEFEMIKRFGFQSGRTADKGLRHEKQTGNGVPYIETGVNAVLSVWVTKTIDLGTHFMFIGQVTEAVTRGDAPSLTYEYYQSHVKPQPSAKKGYKCKVCGYVYEGEPLPNDYICPLCKHDASYFERI